MLLRWTPGWTLWLRPRVPSPSGQPPACALPWSGTAHKLCTCVTSLLPPRHSRKPTWHALHHRAARVEQQCADPATEAAWAARVQQSGVGALLIEPPSPRAARICFLTTLLRSQQLWHGQCVAPLLDALVSEQEEGNGDFDSRLAGLVLPLMGLMITRGAGGDTHSQLAEVLQRVVLDGSPCVSCAANPPAHAPGDHLRSVAVIALAASVSAAVAAQPHDAAHADADPMAWQAMLDGLTPTQAVCAACLYLATRAHGDADGDEPDAADAACPATAFLLQHSCNGRLAEALRPLPPWLAALACDARPALCAAYVASLLTRPEDGQGAVSARDGAQRLRCCLAAGPTARSATQAAMRAVGCWTHDAGSDALTE